MHTAATTSQAALTASPRLSATMANATAPSVAIAAHSNLVCHAAVLLNIVFMAFLPLRDIRPSASHLEFDADLHHLSAGNLEIGTRPLRVVMHEGKQLLAPARHAGPDRRRDDGLVPGVVRHLVRVALGDLAACHCARQPLRHVRPLHEAEAQFYP